MKIPQMIAAEFRRLTASPMSIVALIALMCVPVLYGGLYLWANQNPYANLDRIPAAIVVDDSGTTVDGKTVNYGDDVADQLIEDGSFQWHRVAQGSAASGVDDSKYDFSITFPKDFSSALASASSPSWRCCGRAWMRWCSSPPTGTAATRWSGGAWRASSPVAASRCSSSPATPPLRLSPPPPSSPGWTRPNRRRSTKTQVATTPTISPT